MKTKMDISALIISFNCWNLLKKCIESIEASSYPCGEIIVIDNASVDGSPEKIRQTFPNVVLVENPDNVGHTKAVNQGCQLAKGDLILLLDADTEIDKDALPTMLNFLQTHPDVWMVAPKTFLGDGTVQDSAKNFPKPINGLFGRQSLLTRLFPDNPFSRRYLRIQNNKDTSPIQVEHVSAACMLFRHNIIDKIGLWDEGFHSYWVDADWCMRIKMAGGKIYYIPEAVITHYEQNQQKYKKSPVRIIKFHTGAYRFYRKYYTWGTLDPRSVAAALALSTRALLLLIANHFKAPAESRSDPLTMKRASER